MSMDIERATGGLKAPSSGLSVPRTASQVLHQNQFENPMIRSAGQAGSQSGLDTESMGVYVDNREQLVRLFGRRRKVAYAAKVVVFLECYLEGIGKSHGHASGGYE